MREKESVAEEFAETLHAAAAAVGQQSGKLNAEGGRSVEIDPEREARVAELRRQYAEGKYDVNAADVAARIVDDHLT